MKNVTRNSTGRLRHRTAEKKVLSRNADKDSLKELQRKLQGFVNVSGFKLFYQSFGEPKRGTVLCLHGGPGGNHESLLAIADLASYGYRVVLYDQLGCGRSELPEDRALFVVERYVDEIEEFRKTMKLGRVHLLGSSCGGQFAFGYALKYQRNLRSLITVGGIHNVPFFYQEMQKMKERLPRDVYSTLLKFERLGEYENPEYLKAVDVFYRRHLCRLERWPEELVRSMEHLSKPVYYTMNGPNEFTVIGNIRHWNVAEQLHRIKVPTLVLTGKYDEVSPKLGRDIHGRMKGSKLVIFPKSSHLPFWEEREKFMRVLLSFLGGEPQGVRINGKR